MLASRDSQQRDPVIESSSPRVNERGDER